MVMLMSCSRSGMFQFDMKLLGEAPFRYSQNNVHVADVGFSWE